MMDRREVMIEIIGVIQEWEDEYEVGLSGQQEYELAEQIYNLLQRRRGEWLRPAGPTAEYEVGDDS